MLHKRHLGTIDLLILQMKLFCKVGQANFHTTRAIACICHSLAGPKASNQNFVVEYSCLGIVVVV